MSIQYDCWLSQRASPNSSSSLVAVYEDARICSFRAPKPRDRNKWKHIRNKQDTAPQDLIRMVPWDNTALHPDFKTNQPDPLDRWRMTAPPGTTRETLWTVAQVVKGMKLWAPSEKYNG